MDETRSEQLDQTLNLLAGFTGNETPWQRFVGGPVEHEINAYIVDDDVVITFQEPGVIEAGYEARELLDIPPDVHPHYDPEHGLDDCEPEVEPTQPDLTLYNEVQGMPIAVTARSISFGTVQRVREESDDDVAERLGLKSEEYDHDGYCEDWERHCRDIEDDKELDRVEEELREKHTTSADPIPEGTERKLVVDYRREQTWHWTYHVSNPDVIV